MSPRSSNFWSFFLVETGFHHVGQANLELLTSGDPPASASPSAEITSVSHHAQPENFSMPLCLAFSFAVLSSPSFPTLCFVSFRLLYQAAIPINIL